MAFMKGLEHDGTNKDTGRPQFLAKSEDDSVITILLGESPTSKLWSFWWESKSFLDISNFHGYSITEMAQGANISRTSLYKIFGHFIDNEWIIPSKYLKGIQYYKLNKNHFIVRELLKLLSLFIIANMQVEAAKEIAMDELAKEQKNYQGLSTKLKRRN